MNMTRRMKGAYILIPLLCTLCAGCDSKDESLMSTREIGFSTTVASSEAEPGTRAEATTDNLTEMGVFAYFTGTGNFSNGSSTPNHLYNQSVKKTGGVWTYSPVRYWPANANEKVSFFAYAPHTAAVSGNANDKIRITKPTAFNAPGRPVISYSAPKGELDLLLSTGVTDCTNTHGPVQFTMKHAMTKVVFKVKTGGSDSKTITGISTECASSADFSINDANTAVTAENIGTSKSTCTATVSIAADGTAKTVKEFFLIPSHLKDTKVTLTYADGSGSTTVTATLPNVTPNDWLSGKAIGYTLTIQNNQITAITVNSDITWDELKVPIPSDTEYDYIIATAEDLAQFRNDVNNSRIRPIKALQVADIDIQDLATSKNFSNDATDWTPIGYNVEFQGVYNGNGHTIKNLKIKTGKTSQGIGLFGQVIQSLLVGINLRDADITVGSPVTYTGTLAGTVDQETQVNYCSATGKIRKVSCNADGGQPYITGGLIGDAKDASIILCHANVDIGEGGIYNHTSSAAMNACTIGGLVGYMSTNKSRIASCWSSGNIKLGPIPANAGYIVTVGGFLGGDAHSGDIYGSYSLGSIALSFSGMASSGDTRTVNAGGFIGTVNAVLCTSCYSYTPLSLTYPDIDSQGNIGTVNFGGFTPLDYSTFRYCYGDGSVLPRTSYFNYKISCYEFSDSPNSTSYSCNTLGGKTVQEILRPSSKIKSSKTFRCAKYDSSINAYYTMPPMLYIINWDSDNFWKQTPADPTYPEINYYVDMTSL